MEQAAVDFGVFYILKYHIFLCNVLINLKQCTIINIREINEVPPRTIPGPGFLNSIKEH